MDEVISIFKDGNYTLGCVIREAFIKEIFRLRSSNKKSGKIKIKIAEADVTVSITLPSDKEIDYDRI